MTKSILFVTGTRADFGKLEPLAIAARDGGFAVSFFVTGMHMLARYGMTKHEVHRLQGVKVYEYLNQRSSDPQDMILAKTVIGFSDFVREHSPDLVIVHGDRVDATACALVCATNYIRSAHIEGGEVSGTIDEIYRHCNTKLTAAHFVSSQQAFDRVAALGEDRASIYNIGSPELDFHARPSGVTISEVQKRYDIPFEEFGICTFHPVTSEKATMGQQAKDLFGALMSSGRNFVVIAPNNDPGSEAIFQELERLPSERFRVLPSMRFAYFSELMKNASIMVGNSSAGVREAPFLGLPSIDIGTRQTNRALAPSVFRAAASDQNKIIEIINQVWTAPFRPNTAFGHGDAANAFIEVLKDKAFWESDLQKVFQDRDI